MFSGNSGLNNPESEHIPPAIINQSDVRLEYLALKDIRENVEDNPRMSTNEVREELKNSIRSSTGMYILLEVSKRPYEDHYCLIRGGNTRLELLRELALEWQPIGQQTVNPYLHARCLIYPWTNDSEKAIMNATENMVRGRLTYSEEAKAVRILRNQFDASNTGDIGFVDWMKQCGFSMTLNNTAVCRYLYTADVLVKTLPTLMIEGRANSQTARWLQSIRAGLVKLFKGRVGEGVADSDVHAQCNEKADRLLEHVNRRMDAVSLDKPTYTAVVIELFDITYPSMTEAEKTLLGITGGNARDFAIVAGISPNEQLGDDDRKNAAIVVRELLVNGEYVRSNRQTRCLKKMGVTDDIGGFIKIFQLLDAKSQKSLIKNIAG